MIQRKDHWSYVYEKCIMIIRITMSYLNTNYKEYQQISYSPILQNTYLISLNLTQQIWTGSKKQIWGLGIKFVCNILGFLRMKRNYSLDPVTLLYNITCTLLTKLGVYIIHCIQTITGIFCRCIQNTNNLLTLKAITLIL